MTTALFFFNLVHISNNGLDTSKNTREVVSNIVNPILAHQVPTGGALIGIIVDQLGD
jgi:hypothetical protein